MCKIIWSNWGVVPDSEKGILWEQIKRYYIFPTDVEHQELGKRATICTVGNSLRRFRHGLNKFYVQTGISSLNRFGFIMPNEWNTFQQQHTSPEAIALSNKMKELNKKNKFTHRLGLGGYNATMPKWTKKEQELRVAGIPDPLEGCTLRMKNFIRGRSHMDDSGQLMTSSSKVTEVIKKAKTLIDKEKTSEFTPQCEKDQLSVALKSKEHRGRTRAISLIASWKEGFVEDRHMYKKRKSHDEDVQPARINEEEFAHRFFNFMRKTPQYVVQVRVP
jgi:hypothetical protein